jgi:hypothetical protein
MRGRPEPRENRLMEIPRIVSAEAVIQGVLKVRWNDDYAAVVDLRPVIARGGLLSSLQEPEVFRSVAVGEHGYGVLWRTSSGEELDLGSDSLRQRAERQAELHLRAG